MSYQVALLNFEGPLDLLLQLIERSDMEVTEISLSDITAQYLSYITELPALGTGDLNQFLELASRLIYLKSVALLPDTPSNEAEDEIADLTEQLAQYQQYQSAARHLEGLLRESRPTWPRQAKPNLPTAKLPLPSLSTDLLESAFRKALANLPEITTEPALAPGVTLSEMTERLSLWVNSQGSPSALNDFIGQLTSRTELIVAFLATLELIRQRLISVTQDRLFAQILVQKIDINPKTTHDAN